MFGLWTGQGKYQGQRHRIHRLQTAAVSAQELIDSSAIHSCNGTDVLAVYELHRAQEARERLSSLNA